MLIPKGILLLPPNGNAGISRTTLSKESFCWRENWGNRFESLWWLLHKFAFLNAGSIDIGESLGAKSANKDTLRYRNMSDLRYFKMIMPEKMSIVFGIDEKFIDECVVSAYLTDDEIENLSSSSLRFCNLCLQEGFHSTIFQLLVFNKCPIHHENLIGHCPACKHEIPYQLNVEAFRKPYSCSECHSALSRAIVTENKSLKLSKDREKVFSLISDWLKRRLRLQIGKRGILSENELKTPVLKNQQSFHDKSRLIIYWMEALGSELKLRKILAEQSVQRDIHSIVEFKSIVEEPKAVASKKYIQRPNLFGNDWNRELLGIYKAIRRHFVKTQLRKHTKCVWKYSRRDLWDKDLSFQEGQVCRSANAYLLWRMCLEGVAHPLALFRRYRSLDAFGSYLQWDLPSNLLPLPVLKRIFALDCYWLFYECKLLANIFHANNIYSFRSRYLTKQLTPYWMMVKVEGSTTNIIEFHWWIDKQILKNHKSLRKLEKRIV